MRSGAGAALARLAACLNSGGVGPTVTMAPLTGDQVAAMMIDFVIETLPHNYSDHLCGKPKLIAPRHVRRAVDHIHAHLTESLSIDDLAELSGVSRRALHYGFKRFIGSSPADYQRSERLVAARRDIEANPDETVAVVAHRWGFSNAGRFNQQFRLRFGESAASLRARVRLRPGAESPD
jgi:transcriptional regulator GlxA family with amidase domain